MLPNNFFAIAVVQGTGGALIACGVCCKEGRVEVLVDQFALNVCDRVV